MMWIHYLFFLWVIVFKSKKVFFLFVSSFFLFFFFAPKNCVAPGNQKNARLCFAMSPAKTSAFGPVPRPKIRSNGTLTPVVRERRGQGLARGPGDGHVKHFFFFPSFLGIATRTYSGVLFLGMFFFCVK